MINTMSLTLLLAATGAFANGHAAAGCATPVPIIADARPVDPLAEVRVALAQARTSQPLFRIAEQYDPSKDCKCRRYEITWTRVCMFNNPDGSCAKWELIEERVCVDWHCHARS